MRPPLMMASVSSPSMMRNDDDTLEPMSMRMPSLMPLTMRRPLSLFRFRTLSPSSSTSSSASYPSLPLPTQWQWRHQPPASLHPWYTSSGRWNRAGGFVELENVRHRRSSSPDVAKVRVRSDLGRRRRQLLSPSSSPPLLLHRRNLKSSVISEDN